MTVQITMAQRQMLDTLRAAGDNGVLINLNSPTARTLVSKGYAEWKKTTTQSVLSTLRITPKAANFYRS